MAQSIASRPRRPQQSEPDDIVLARAVQFTEWARRNVKLIAIGSVVVVVLVAGIFWYRTDRERRMDEAAIAFLQVEQAVLGGNETVALQDLQLFLQQHGSTPYGDEARVLAGQIHLGADRPAEAVEVLRPVADRMNRSPVGVQAAMLLAAAQEAAGDTDAALRTYLQVADGAGRAYQREDALMSAALMRQDAGDYSGAAELYQRLVSSAESGSAERSMYEMRLAEAEALATLQ